MIKSVKATKRTLSAIRTADRIGRDLTVAKKSFIPVNKKNNSVSGGDTYNGAFKVIKKNDTTIAILGFGAGRRIHNNIIAGLQIFEIAGDTNVTISQSTVIYASISYNSDYIIEYLSATSLPQQTEGNYYITIATIEFINGKITNIIQSQYGDINIAGRFV